MIKKLKMKETKKIKTSMKIMSVYNDKRITSIKFTTGPSITREILYNAGFRMRTNYDQEAPGSCNFAILLNIATKGSTS